MFKQYSIATMNQPHRLPAWNIAIAGMTAVVLLAACGRSDPARNNPPSPIVTDGHARFTVLTPTLIRLEYAQDDHFEDALTQTVATRALPAPAFSTEIEHGERVIRTGKLVLRYRQDSGAFSADNLSIEVGTATAHPRWSPEPSRANLGGWRRGLDNDQDPQPLHDGLLSRDGWFLLDDSRTVLMTTTAPGFAARPVRDAAYQDGYFFGYGSDYRQGLADLRQLTGPAPLLPRKAFGVWFSRYWAYSDAEIRELITSFRAHAVPLDTLSIDTDWKQVHNAQGCVIFSAVAGARPGDPCSWNGWDWNRDLFPDPPAFLAWLHEQGVQVGLNIHPSIASTDPQFAAVQAATGGLRTDPSTPPCTLFQADPLAQCHVFDWTNPRHLDAYFALHLPLPADDFWWLDWCCDGSSAIAPGLAADTWINSRYALDNQKRGSRWAAFSRIGASFQEGKAGSANNGAGAFAEHRYSLHFTGDTCGTWPMLAFEAELTAAEGNIGLPYVSHDIGSFLGPPTATGCNGTLGHTAHLPDDMYVRWLQFGTFQPLDRLHSHHGDRLPWDYPGAAEQAATAFLRLRERLVPFLYSLARESYDSGLPMVRSLYLQWPQLDEAYAHRSEYTLGDDLLVAPVITPGDPARVEVWIPPGTWTDYFTGEQIIGPVMLTRSVPLDRYPVFLRAGAILPLQPDLPTTAIAAPDPLRLEVWPGADGRFDLYDDAGQGFGYRSGEFSRTTLRTSTSTAGCVSVDIGAARGGYPGAPAQRSWDVRLIGVPAPAVVTIGGQRQASGWVYDEATRTLEVHTGRRSTAESVAVKAGLCP
jgi:alpha-glucosidase (family GH31 glycosyl hydrolase)